MLLLNAAILVFCLASSASGERIGQRSGCAGCGPCRRLPAARFSLPGNPLPIGGCRRATDLCRRVSSPRTSALKGTASRSSILLSLRGGGAAATSAATATSAKPKSALKARTANPRNDKGSGRSVADGRKKASMSASVFNLVNNVAGAFIHLVRQAAPLRAVVCAAYYVLYYGALLTLCHFSLMLVCVRARLCRGRDLGLERGTGHGNRMGPEHRHVRRPWRIVGPLLFDRRDRLRGARPKGL
jgi:hypothetical protein